MRKKYLAILLATAMTVSLAGCGGSSDQGKEPAQEESTQTQEESTPAQEEAPDESQEADAGSSEESS